MAEPSREGTHEIEYATAQVEAVMAKSEAAITILLDSPMAATGTWPKPCSSFSTTTWGRWPTG